MKVLYFTDTFLPKVDGISISITNFCKILSAGVNTSGESYPQFEFVICCPRYGKDDINQLNDKVHIERFSNTYLPSYPDIKVVMPSPGKIKKIIKNFQPDIIHIHSPGLLGLYGVRVARKYGIRLIGTYHTLVSEQDMYLSFYRLLKIDKLVDKVKKLKRKLDTKDLIKVEKKKSINFRKKVILKVTNYLYDSCDLVISPSYLLRDQLHEFGIKKPVSVVSNGIDLSRFSGKSKKFSGTNKLLHVGRISYEKNCDIVLKAFSLIREERKDSTLTIIGEGPALDSLKTEADKLELGDSVLFAGFIENKQLPELYVKYDLFITASTMETQGIVILEALASGLPAVGVKAYAVPELIQDGRNGFNAEPFAVKELALLSLKILGDSELYEKFSAESLQIAKGHDLYKCANELVKVYQEVYKAKKEKNEKLSGVLIP